MDKWLLRLAGYLLILTGFVKLISAFSAVRYLDESDPVLFFLRNKNIFLIAGVAELFLAWTILSAPQKWYARFGLLALCATFAVWRVGASILADHHPCPCLGRATDWLHLTPGQANSLALLLLFVLAAIAFMSIALHGKFHNSVAQAGTSMDYVKAR